MFNSSEATPKVIANATAEKISTTCQKIILRNGRFIDLKLVEIVHNEITDDYVFRYDIQYEKPMFKRELKVTIDAETQNMLKARYGDDVANKLADRLDVKTVEVKRDNKAPRRKGGDRKDRPQRQQKEKKE